MFNSKLFTYASLLSSSLLVTGSPVHKKREIDVPSDAELYLGGVEPDGNLAINPPITKPEGTVRIMSLGKADTGSPSNGGKNFDQILNVPNANASVGDDSYTFTMTNTLKNPAFTFKLIKRECPNQNISLYRHTNGTYLYNTTFATVVQDVNSAGQTPQKYRDALNKALQDTKADYIRKVNTTFALEPAYQNVSTPLGGPFTRGPSVMKVFGVSGTSGFNYSMVGDPPTSKTVEESTKSMGTGILVYLNQAYDALIDYCSSNSNPLPTQQAIVLWASLDSLRSLQNLAVKTIKAWAVQNQEDFPVEVPRDRSIQVSLDGLLSGAIGSIGDRFARVENLQKPIDDAASPQC